MESASCFLLGGGADGDQSVGQGIRIGNKFYASGFFYCLGSKEKPYQIREMEVRPTHWMRAPELPENPINKAESNMPPLPDPVGMHAPAGRDGDKFPVWHRGQMLDYARAAMLKERQEIEKIVRMHGISPNPIDDPHPDAELINGALSCVVDAIRSRP